MMAPHSKGGTVESGIRLKEILSILNRHRIIKGLTPEKLRLILEDLGPTFIKLGQIMSMRTDMIPADFCAELAKLRSHVAPMSFEDVCSVLNSAYGQPYDEIFSRFDREPLGSASIAQAHYTELKDGSPAVVKVQRIGIYDTMANDISLLRRASVILKLAGEAGEVVDLNMVLDELWRVAQEEMNFLVEARNTAEFAELNREVAYVACPGIIRDLSTGNVLVMEYIDGFEINDTEGLSGAGYDMHEIGIKLAENYLKQIIDDGFFHADPHPDNLKIREGRIVWIDMGMMGRLNRRDRGFIQQAIIAIAKNDVGGVKDVVLAMGEHRSPINHARLYTDIDDFMTRYGSMDLGDMKVSRVMENIFEVALAHHLTMPSGIALLGRGIATLEGVLSEVSPDISLLQVTTNRLSGSFLKDLDWKKELGGVMTEMLDSGRKALGVPTLASDLLKMTVKGQARLNVELSSSHDFVKTITHLTDKVVIGILVAALLVGSSLISTTDMQPKLLGIPALGIVGYVAAVVLMGWLLYDKLRGN